MSNAQDFVTSFMTKLAGTATLTPALKGVFAKILANQVVVADGTVSFKASFANLSEIFTFIATPAAERPANPLAYTDAQVNAATTAAATETGLTVGEEIPTEAPTDEPTEEPTDGPTDEPTEEPGDEGETSSLTAALEVLQTAQEDESTFLKAQIENELLTTLTASSSLADIRTAIDGAKTAADGALSTARGTKSDNVLNAELTDAQEALATQVQLVNVYPGLMGRIEADKLAKQAVIDATADATLATALSGAAVIVFGAKNDGVTATPGTATTYTAGAFTAQDLVTDTASGTIAVISIDATGKLTVADAYKAKVGINDLLAAIQADVDAIKAKADTEAAAVVAANGIVATDETAIEAALETTMKSAIVAANSNTTATDVTAVETATEAAVTAKALTAAQKTAIDKAFTTAYLPVDDAAGLALAQAAAKAVYDPIVAAATKAKDIATAEATLVTSYKAAVTAVDTKQGEVDTRDGLIQKAQDTAALKTTADEKAAAIVTAEEALTEAGFVVVSVDKASFTADAADEIFLLGTIDSAITSFSKTVVVEGKVTGDKLYVGEAYEKLTVLEGTTLPSSNIGDVAVREAIVFDNGTDTEIYFENAAFSGQTAGFAGGESTLITLTGVTGAEVSLDGGFLTIA